MPIWDSLHYRPTTVKRPGIKSQDLPADRSCLEYCSLCGSSVVLKGYHFTHYNQGDGQKRYRVTYQCINKKKKRDKHSQQVYFDINEEDIPEYRKRMLKK